MALETEIPLDEDLLRVLVRASYELMNSYDACKDQQAQAGRRKAIEKNLRRMKDYLEERKR